MRKSKKKLLAMLLAGAMVFGTLPSDAFANNEQDQTSVIVEENVTTDDSANMENENAVEAVTEDETPATEETTEAKTQAEAVSLEKTEEVIAGEKYVIVYDNKEALSVGKDQVIAVPVEVEGDTVKTEITKNMVWTVDDNNNLVSELGKKLSSELTLQEDNGQSFKFNAKNVYYENGEVNTYLAYNEESNKWSFNTELNETVTYYRVIGPTESLSELTDEKVEEYAPSNEVTEEPEVEDDEVTEEPEVDGDEITEEVNDEIVIDLEEDVPTTFAYGDITYKLDTDGIDSGSEYLIVASSNQYALRNINGKLATSDRISISDNSVTNIQNASLWTFIKNEDESYIIKDGDYFLGINGSSLVLQTTSTNWYIDNTTNGNYTIYNGSKFLGYSNWFLGGSFNLQDNPSTQPTLRLYKKVVELPVADDKIYPDDVIGDNDYPTYPSQGSVLINKGATGLNFNSTGVAQVELGVTGLPVKKGVDVVLVLDLSGSMNDNSKLANAKEAAKSFVDSIFANNDDGSQSNNRLSLVTFSKDNSHRNKIQYGLKNANSKQNLKNTIDSLSASGGTDYDIAFNMANTVLDTADSNRDKYIVFMTDGAPGRYNGNNAESSRGSLTPTYRNAVLNNTLTNAETSKSKGATIYSIGYDLANGSSPLQDATGFSGTECTSILQKISSTSDKCISAESATDLKNAFAAIASQIRKAGTEAVVTDIIGDNFILQTASKTPNTPNTVNQQVDLSPKPTIEIKLYDLYTKSDVGKTINNITVTEDMIGQRKGTFTTIETISFNDEGTEATSDKLTASNIMASNGNITAKNFRYIESEKKFIWTLGDITGQEAAISYYVYLIGSLEGTRYQGLYDTNKDANLTYKNYLGHDCSQTFEKPKLPWGSAQVSYEFYLADSQGQPVNYAGEVIPFAHRIIVEGPKTMALNWNEQAILNASSLKENNYTLVDSNSSYTVTPKSDGTGTGTASGTGTVIVSQSSGYMVSRVAFAVQYTAKLNPDTVVLDYGKSILIDVMSNDTTVGAVLNSISTALGSDVTLGTGTTTTLNSGFTGSITITNNGVQVGTAEIVTIENAKYVKYTPTKYIETVDTFYYAASIKTNNDEGGTSDYYQYQTVTVMPATTVYYEDNFGVTFDEDGKVINSTGIQFSGNWTKVGTTNGGNQDNGIVGGNGQSAGLPYGYDSSYAEDSEFSNGSAISITGNGKTGEDGTTATFRFNGTGFDIIGRTDTNTGLVRLRVYEIVNDERVSKPVKEQYLDTYYKSGVLYQIPVLNYYSEKYATYEVELTVGNDQVFYLDAVRLYNPLGITKDQIGDVAYNQYAADNELNANIREVRNILIGNNSFKLGSDSANGIVYVDGSSCVDDIGIYTKIGPNNEVYLEKGNAIAFNISDYTNATSIQIGLKKPYASEVEGEVNVYGLTDSITVNTATDMYYDITSAVKANDGLVVITNNSNTIISVTNIKTTSGTSSKSFDITSNEQTVILANMLAYEASTNKSADVDGSGEVDILDLANVANNQGKEIILGVSTEIYKQDLTATRDINRDDLNIVKAAIE